MSSRTERTISPRFMPSTRATTHRSPTSRPGFRRVFRTATQMPGQEAFHPNSLQFGTQFGDAVWGRRMKGDERILGEGNFVETVLKAAQEKLDRKYHIQSRGDSFKRLIERVAKVFEISPKELLSGGKHSKTVKARSVFRYGGNRELGMSTIELSKKMNISQPTVSQSVVRGQKIVHDQKLESLE